MDFYGHGGTPHPDRPLTVGDFAAAVAEIIEFLGERKVNLVGHSFGGRVAIELAAKFPQYVDKLVLVDSAGVKPRRGPLYYARVFTHKLLKRFGGGLKGSDDYAALSGAMKETFKNVVNYDQRPLLKDISAPTAIFWGDKDTATPPYMARILNKKIKNSHLFWLHGAGHFSYIDSIGRFTAVLSAFLEGK